MCLKSNPINTTRSESNLPPITEIEQEAINTAAINALRASDLIYAVLSNYLGFRNRPEENNHACLLWLSEHPQVASALKSITLCGEVSQGAYAEGLSLLCPNVETLSISSPAIEPSHMSACLKNMSKLQEISLTSASNECFNQVTSTKIKKLTVDGYSVTNAIFNMFQSQYLEYLDIKASSILINKPLPIGITEIYIDGNNLDKGVSDLTSLLESCPYLKCIDIEDGEISEEDLSTDEINEAILEARKKGLGRFLEEVRYKEYTLNLSELPISSDALRV